MSEAAPAGETRGAPEPAMASDTIGGIVLDARQLAEMVAQCLRAHPEEGCGLIGGDPATGHVAAVYPARNAAASALVYELDSRDYLRADREAEAAGHAIIGVFHSHTHTDPYPSPTDVGQAPDPLWHYIVVSLRHEHPSTRSYRIVGGEIAEEPITLLEAAHGAP